MIPYRFHPDADAELEEEVVRVVVDFARRERERGLTRPDVRMQRLREKARHTIAREQDYAEDVEEVQVCNRGRSPLFDARVLVHFVQKGRGHRRGGGHQPCSRNISRFVPLLQTPPVDPPFDHVSRVVRVPLGIGEAEREGQNLLLEKRPPAASAFYGIQRVDERIL